ncbi:toprim domain-containing protein, partial [Solemya elarraichensis gill symbiont]
FDFNAKRESLNKLWATRYDPYKSLQVMKYLRDRGIANPNGVYASDHIHGVNDNHIHKLYQGMIAMVTSSDGVPLTIHRTYLEYGGKANMEAPRKLMPSVHKLSETGAAIRLSDVKENIGIAEGIETALICKQVFGIDTWSSINASLMESFVPPDGVTNVTIFGDNDSNFRGQKSAYILAGKLYSSGIQVDVRIPDEIGDFNDLYLTENN